MKNPSKHATPTQDRARELRKELANKIAFFIGSRERLSTDVPGLLLSRRTAPTAPTSATYEPSLAVVAQGRKQADLGGTTFIFDESRYLLTSLDLPVICNVIEASEEAPYLCFVLKLEMPVVRELLTREEIQTPALPPQSPAMATGETTCRVAGCMLPAGGPAGNATGHSVSFGTDSTRDHLPNLAGTGGGAPASDCAGRSEPPDRKGHRVGQDQLREAATRGRSCENRRHGSLNAAPPFSGADRRESSSVSKATAVACSPGTHADGWSGRRQRGI
jgi:hypothetical protein